MSHIFISYSRHDQHFARQLADDLRHHGYDVWIDDRIDYGDRWWRNITQAIDGCAAFVVVMTPDSEASEWVEREVLLAQRRKKPLFPLLLAGEEFPLLIATHFVDVRQGNLPAADFYDRLAKVIQPREDTGAFIRPGESSEAEKNPVRWGWLVGIVIIAVLLVLGAVFQFGGIGGDGEEVIVPSPTNSAARDPLTPTEILTNTVAPSSTPLVLDVEVTPTVTPVFCGDAPPSQITVGHPGRVTLDDPRSSFLRDAPGYGGNIVATMEPGTPFDVISGPRCVDNGLWWELRLQDDALQGWALEGADDGYYLENLPTSGGD